LKQQRNRTHNFPDIDGQKRYTKEFLTGSRVFDTHEEEANVYREQATSEAKSVNPFILARGAQYIYAR